MKSILGIAVALLCTQTMAASLAPDALLCERETELATVAAEPWGAKGATEALRQAKLHADFYAGSAQLANVQKNLAVDEERARADANLRLSSGSTSTRGAAATADGSAATSKAGSYRQVLASCASSGDATIEAHVLERKPISGFVKIRTQFRGADAELWVSASSVL